MRDYCEALPHFSKVSMGRVSSWSLVTVEQGTLSITILRLDHKC